MGFWLWAFWTVLSSAFMPLFHICLLISCLTGSSGLFLVLLWYLLWDFVLWFVIVLIVCTCVSFPQLCLVPNPAFCVSSLVFCPAVAPWYLLVLWIAIVFRPFVSHLELWSTSVKVWLIFAQWWKQISIHPFEGLETARLSILQESLNMEITELQWWENRK